MNVLVAVFLGQCAVLLLRLIALGFTWPTQDHMPRLDCPRMSAETPNPFSRLHLLRDLVLRLILSLQLVAPCQLKTTCLAWTVRA